MTDAPSLQLRILFKGKHMNIHGQSVFDVFAKPVVPDDGTSVRYDGFATFIQGDNQFTYVVVDGAAYVEKSVGNDSTSVATKADRCLESITPFDSIVAALNTVKAIPSTSAAFNDESVNCSSGTLLQTSTPFGGLDWISRCVRLRLVSSRTEATSQWPSSIWPVLCAT
ncbi:unnamed protein product [Phytophthora lilii]|uniref:Unnamed protein product n=1 Tax=Phytophthora lilii TaxID=2077276 RepID=A0A9W6WZG9_9STRA|nr:unnamed protein product [Phytophthora lilii]